MSDQCPVMFSAFWVMSYQCLVTGMSGHAVLSDVIPVFSCVKSTAMQPCHTSDQYINLLWCQISAQCMLDNGYKLGFSLCWDYFSADFVEVPVAAFMRARSMSTDSINLDLFYREGLKFQTSFWTQYTTLLKRTFLQARARILSKLNIIQTVVLAIFCGLIWWQTPRTEETLTDRMGMVSIEIRAWQSEWEWWVLRKHWQSERECWVLRKQSEWEVYLVCIEYLSVKCLSSVWGHSMHFRFSPTL